MGKIFIHVNTFYSVISHLNYCSNCYTVYLYIVDFKTTLICSRHIWGNSIKVEGKQCKTHTELEILD